MVKFNQKRSFAMITAKLIEVFVDAFASL